MGELVAEEHGMYRWIDGHGEAPGAPGLEPRWTSSQKSVVGTAYSTSSKIWWTTSHGTINEIYNPTIDKPQVRDLEFLVTDGESFVHEEKRDLRHKFSYLSKAAPAVGIVNSDPDGALQHLEGDHQRSACAGAADAGEVRRGRRRCCAR